MFSCLYFMFWWLYWSKLTYYIINIWSFPLIWRLCNQFMKFSWSFYLYFWFRTWSISWCYLQRFSSFWFRSRCMFCRCRRVLV